MSKHEDSLTLAVWERDLGGSLWLECPIPANGSAKRKLDGVVDLDGPRRLTSFHLSGRDLCVVQTKAKTMGVHLFGQALLSPDLVAQHWKPRSVRSIAVCTGDNTALAPVLEHHGIETVVEPHPAEAGGRRFTIGRLQGAARAALHSKPGELVERFPLSETVVVEGLIRLGRHSAVRAPGEDLVLDGAEVLLVHTFHKKLGMYVAGEAIACAALARSRGARAVQSRIYCSHDDRAVGAALRRYLPDVQVVAGGVR